MLGGVVPCHASPPPQHAEPPRGTLLRSKVFHTPAFCDSFTTSMASIISSYNKYQIRNRNPNPKTSVLLVIDMQNYFYSIAKPIIPSITSTIHTCRRASIPIIFTRHCHKSPADYAMLGEWWNNDLIIDGTPESELMAEMGRLEEEVVVEKNTYSGFRGTQLEERLREMGVEEVIVTGVMTNLCCETTAREAFVRGFRVFFSTDATATSEEDLHQATLNNMAYGFAYLVDCNSLQQAFCL